MLGVLLNRPARMTAFTVHEPADAGGSKDAQAENLLFVRDGFSWPALLFSPIYLVVRGEWRAFALYVVVAVVLTTLMQVLGAKPDWIAWVILLLNVVIGFELSELRRWSLEKSGWRQIATVNGASQDEAERRFFEAWLPTLAETPHSDGARLDDGISRVERAVEELAARLRSKFALKT